MALKIEIIVVMVFVVITVSGSRDKKSICTLDGMRSMAIDACEHLLGEEGKLGESRAKGKRDISDNEVDNTNNTISYDEIPNRHEKVRINRTNYPKGGYLVLSHHHARILLSRNHNPVYITSRFRRHVKQLLRRGLRDKRETPEYVNMPYCCMHRCRLDYFCRS